MLSSHHPIEFVYEGVVTERVTSPEVGVLWQELSKYKFTEEKVNRVENEIRKTINIFEEKWAATAGSAELSVIEEYNNYFSHLACRSFAPL